MTTFSPAGITFPTKYVVVFHEHGGDRIFLYSSADALHDDLVNVPPSDDEPADIYAVRNIDGGTELLAQVTNAHNSRHVTIGNRIIKGVVV